jgi:exosortase A-associated hydrolase 2
MPLPTHAQSSALPRVTDAHRIYISLHRGGIVEPVHHGEHVIPEHIKARFLDSGRGRVFALLRPPAQSSGVGVLVAPPFAEEMNKARKMLSDVGQALQARGVATVVVDPYGTGDSEGEFRDSSWACWIEDLARAASWAAAEGYPIRGLLGIRLGCLLGAQLAQQALPGLQCSVFWQPVVDGERFLTQFLRLRVAASMMEPTRESVSGLRQTLRDGRCVEVAGYELSPTLAGELEKLRLTDALGSHLGALHWMELVRDPQGSLPAAAETCVGIARSRGLEITVRTVAGEQFWDSSEIVRIPELVERTVEALADIGRARVSPDQARHAGHLP